MDQYYQPLYRQAAAMQHQFHDYSLNMAHDPTAMVMRNEMHKLTDDLATSKNPRTIENRLQLIENQLRRSEMSHRTQPVVTPGAYPIMHADHTNQLLGNLEQMRQNLRQHPRY
jgi:hypothetical protein